MTERSRNVDEAYDEKNERGLISREREVGIDAGRTEGKEKLKGVVTKSGSESWQPGQNHSPEERKGGRIGYPEGRKMISKTHGGGGEKKEKE